MSSAGRGEGWHNALSRFSFLPLPASLQPQPLPPTPRAAPHLPMMLLIWESFSTCCCLKRFSLCSRRA